MDAPNETPPGRASSGGLRWLLLTGSVAVLLSRALFLPPTLEDIDSVNFALALERFDPRLHQPHPPGYPVYIALARAVNTVIPDPAKALSFLSALAQTALIFPLFTLFRGLGSTRERATLSTLLTMACPILWFNGARPMSDSVGLLFVTTTQALILRSLGTSASLPTASLLAGLSLGVRMQTGILTVPLWLFALGRTRTWRWPFAALAAGLLAWIVPLIAASGGPAEYAQAFAQTMGDAAGSEPLIGGFTLNRAARALFKVMTGAWASRSLGLAVTALAAVGFIALARRRRGDLALGSLVFLPYLLFHLLIQHVEAVRYSLPYIPWMVWLAVEGAGSLAGQFPGARWAQRAAVSGLITASFMVVLPALSLYHLLPSPPYAALAMVGTQGAAPRDWVLAGHYMYWRYFRLRPPGMELLSAAPGEALSRLSGHFLTGDGRKVLFLADPRRTDLVSFSQEARRLLGHWDWPVEVRPFLSGERPNEADLFAMADPLYFSGDGWLLSLEAGRVEEVARDPLREAFLKAMPKPTFLLLAGRPTAATGECTLDLKVPGLLTRSAPCRGPVLLGYVLPPSSDASTYLRLSAISQRAGVPTGMPFALQGLDYGPIEAPGFVQGDGWYFPERDESLERFRWASPQARSLLHIPKDGARLIVDGSAPIAYLGTDARIEISADGVVLTSARLTDKRFHLEVDFQGGDPAFREIILRTSRSFVPDAIQNNGDQRELSIRVYEFSLESGHGGRPAVLPLGPRPE